MYSMKYNVLKLPTDGDDPFGSKWWTTEQRQLTYRWGRIAAIVGFRDADVKRAVHCFVRQATDSINKAHIIFSAVPILVISIISQYVGGEFLYYWPIHNGFLMSSACYIIPLRDINL